MTANRNNDASRRRGNLLALREHAWFDRLYARLSSEELQTCHRFIDEHDALDRSEFEMRVNRMFLDKPKPKNWTVIAELLTVANGDISKEQK